jgi:hypothetical protein
MNTSFDESGQKERLISLLRKFEQELLEDKNVNKKHKKWFDWHWFPEEPIKLSSVVEMTVFLLICIGCFFLYYRWNVVPNKEFEIQIEDLSDGVVYDSTRVRVDSVRRVFTCEINYNIPMTRHEEFTEGLNACILNINPLYSDDKYSEFMKYTFLNDSLRNNLNDNKSSTEACVNALLRKYNLTKEFESIDRFRTASNKVESYKKTFLDSLNVPQDSFIMAISFTKESLPFLTQSIRPGGKHGDNLIYNLHYSNDKKYYHTDSYFYFDNKTIKSIKGPHTNIKTVQNDIKFSTIPKILRFFNIFSPFVTGGTMMTPPWGRLEDISQAYINLKLESYTVDSIVLNLNFIGATEFSQMDPIPDKVGMSNIIFNDPVKIYKIKANGLRFHARFIELENWQQIRVFTVTAIMSAFVLVFVVFAISAYFKIRKKIQENGGRNMHKYIYWTYIVFAGFILYSFFYWTFMCFAIDIEEKFAEILIYNIPIPVGAIKCHIITIPIVLIILLLSNRKGRGFLNKIVTNRYFKKVIIVGATCIFIVLLCFALHRVTTMDYSTLLKYGKNRRATQMIYNKIMSSDTVDAKDLKNLHKALESGSLVPDSIFSGRSNIKDGILVLRDYDTLKILDFHNEIFKRYIIPNLYYYGISDSVVYAYQKYSQEIDDIYKKGKWYIYSKRNQYSDPKIIINYSNQNRFLKGILDKRKTAAIEGYDSIFIIDYSYKPRLINRIKLPDYNGEPLYWDNKIFIWNNKNKKQLSIYDISCDELLYTTEGEDFKLLNELDLVIYFKNKKTNCFLSKSPNGLKLDSLDHFYGLSDNLIPSSVWTSKSVNILKRATWDNKLVFLGTDNEGLYFFNENTKEIEFCNPKNNIKSTQKMPYNSWPSISVNEKGTFFVQKNNDSLFIFGKKKLISKKRVSNIARYRDGYIIDQINGKIVVYPYSNFQDSLVLEDNNKFVRGWGIDIDTIVNKWIFLKYGNILYLDNIESNHSLIKRSKYLTDSQKERLIKKLSN